MTKKAPEIRFKGFEDDWEQRKLGDMAESFEYGLNSAAISFDGENKYLRITDIDDSSNLFKQNSLTSPDTNLEISDNYLLKKGDVLFARTGASVGKTYRYQETDGKVYYAGFLIRARIKSLFDPEFVFQNTLTSKYNNFIKITSQRSGQPGVNAQEYRSFELYVPTLKEQQKVGTVLKIIDDTIALHQRKLKQLELLKRALLQKLFPKTGETVPELRFRDFNESWEQRKLEDIVDKVKSYSLSREVETNEYTGYKYIHYGDIHTSVANIIDETSTLPNIKIKSYDLLNKNDLILADASEDYQGIAMPAVVDINPPYKLVAGLHTIALRPTNANSMFLYYLIRSPIFRKYGYRIGTGMKVFGISATNVLKFETKFPSEKEQEKISSLLKRFDDTIALHQRKIKVYQKFKKSLLQKMFI